MVSHDSLAAISGSSIRRSQYHLRSTNGMMAHRPGKPQRTQRSRSIKPEQASQWKRTPARIPPRSTVKGPERATQARQAQKAPKGVSQKARVSTPGSVCGFMDLPAELRNKVYELVYPHIKEKAWQLLDLLKASPPTKDLLLACRQIHSEAHLLYKISLRRYWTINMFWFDSDFYKTPKPYRIAFKSLGIRNMDIDRIKHLIIRSQFIPDLYHRITWNADERIWGFEDRRIGQKWRHHHYFFMRREHTNGSKTLLKWHQAGADSIVPAVPLSTQILRIVEGHPVRGHNGH